MNNHDQSPNSPTDSTAVIWIAGVIVAMLAAILWFCYHWDD